MKTKSRGFFPLALAISIASLPAMAFEISTGTNFSASNTVSLTSYSATGTVSKLSTAHRVIDQTDLLGQHSVGNFNEVSTQTTHVNQSGVGTGVSGSVSIGVSSDIGGLNTGYVASTGGGFSTMTEFDNSVITENGVSIAAVVIDIGGSYVGSATEIVSTNTAVSLNNVDITSTTNTWNDFTVYAN